MGRKSITLFIGDKPTGEQITASISSNIGIPFDVVPSKKNEKRRVYKIIVGFWLSGMVLPFVLVITVLINAALVFLGLMVIWLIFSVIATLVAFYYPDK